MRREALATAIIIGLALGVIAPVAWSYDVWMTPDGKNMVKWCQTKKTLYAFNPEFGPSDAIAGVKLAMGAWLAAGSVFSLGVSDYTDNHDWGCQQRPEPDRLGRFARRTGPGP